MLRRPERERRLRLVARAVQVRLRFIAVLLAAFLVVGFWGHLRNYWDTFTHRFSASHAREHAVSADTEYFCPMDPGVVSDWPAICPVCNMDLVRRKKGEAVVLPEGVVARMQFSPYRVQLAGISTSVIRREPLAREFFLSGRLVESGEAPEKGRDGSSALSPARSPDLVLECNAYLRDLIYLTPGRQVHVAFDGLPGLPAFAGSIIAAESRDGRTEPVVRVRLENLPVAVRKGMSGTARIPVPLSEIEPFAASLAKGPDVAAGFVAVPETAVIDTGNHQVVFVETMPGMFDGVEVKLGPRCGEYFPVITGLEPGQKVATSGAFLIDAEARLSPNLAAGYFGAARTAESEPAANSAALAPIAKRVKLPKSSSTSTLVLSAADRALVEKQKTCPVTGFALDSMGGPIAVDVEGWRVFICCKGCESKLKQDAQKYLAKLKANLGEAAGNDRSPD